MDADRKSQLPAEARGRGEKQEGLTTEDTEGAEEDRRSEKPKTFPLIHGEPGLMTLMTLIFNRGGRKGRSGRGGLPEASGAVAIERLIIADDGEVLFHGLGDEHAVERIAVRPRKQAGAEGVFDGDGQSVKVLLAQVVGKAGNKVLRRGQASVFEFHGNLPNAGGADQNAVAGLLDMGASGAGELRVIIGPPEQGVGIEEKAH